jgi:hypothetical protein
VWGIARRFVTTWYRWERPPSDDMQHLPFILDADAGVSAEDSAKPDIASDKITAIDLMVDLPMLLMT